MPKIKKLDPKEIIKIAAGEVIERPSNVIKELLENAIDAQATQITLSIEDAGKKLIKITDNGIGMSKEDALLCIEHHATSKLNSVHDLDKILTFGFRGEALSSITSISKVTLTTKEESDLTATELKIVASEIIDIKTVASNTGTSISIEDLFFNVPVRKKFLKSKETEFRAILHLFHAFCLSNLSVSFKLFSDKKQLYNCPAAKTLKERLEQIYDQDLTNNTITVEENDDDNLKLSGIITKPSYNRYDRNQIFTFVNNRWVKNYKLTQALIKAYRGSLQPDKYPAGFLFLAIDTKEIDINIHPKKEEIQFLYPRIAENFITKTVKNSLDNSVQQSLYQGTENNADAFALLKEDPFQPTKPASISTYPIHKEPTFTLAPPKATLQEQSTPLDSTVFSDILNNYFDSPNSTSKGSIDNKMKQEAVTNNRTSSTVQFPETNKQIVSALPIFNQTLGFKGKIVGQLFNTYIIIENNIELVLVDQHAAHERIIYEKIKHSQEPAHSINLLINQIITLYPKDLIILEPHLFALHDQGIIAEPFGKDKLIIKALPHYLKNKSVEDIIKQTIALIEHNINAKELKMQIQDDLQKQISCKAAVKGGDKLTHESMQTIINDLYKTTNKLTCPHGRPTIWPITKSEIEKKFKRDYKAKIYSSIFDTE